VTYQSSSGKEALFTMINGCVIRSQSMLNNNPSILALTNGGLSQIIFKGNSGHLWLEIGGSAQDQLLSMY
jgi:hypothetical protein